MTFFVGRRAGKLTMGETRMAEHWRYRVYQGVLVIGGSLVAAYGLRGFLVPNHIIDGGMTGISILLSYLTGLNIGWFLLALNLPFLLLGYNQIGKTFTVLTFLGVAGLAVWTWVLGSAAVVTQDLLLAAVFGGDRGSRGGIGDSTRGFHGWNRNCRRGAQ
ncbi:membrane protein of unknown function [Kyrpidia spormannii]|uniref:YitT family protein n=1 Tax=Kyrpidia spormannii TaxID=2055160 RepID=A0A6F9E330_9BACL|nr:membrane protein of unknown function [Kyrpidia spormannii]